MEDTQIEALLILNDWWNYLNGDLLKLKVTADSSEEVRAMVKNSPREVHTSPRGQPGMRHCSNR